MSSRSTFSKQSDMELIPKQKRANLLRRLSAPKSMSLFWFVCLYSSLSFFNSFFRFPVVGIVVFSASATLLQKYCMPLVCCDSSFLRERVIFFFSRFGVTVPICFFFFFFYRANSFVSLLDPHLCALTSIHIFEPTKQIRWLRKVLNHSQFVWTLS